MHRKQDTRATHLFPNARSRDARSLLCVEANFEILDLQVLLVDSILELLNALLRLVQVDSEDLGTRTLNNLHFIESASTHLLADLLSFVVTRLLFLRKLAELEEGRCAIESSSVHRVHDISQAIR